MIRAVQRLGKGGNAVDVERERRDEKRRARRAKRRAAAKNGPVVVRWVDPAELRGEHR